MKKYDRLEYKIENYFINILISLKSNFLFFFIVFGAIYQVIALYPGFLSQDGWYQYTQAQGLVPFGDWHPPLMAWTWKIMLSIYDSEKLFYALNIFFFWSALYIYFSNISKGILSGVLAFFIGTLPFFTVQVGIAIKDVHFSVIIFFTISLLLKNDIRISRVILVFFLLIYCTFLRNNSIFFTAPIFVFLLYRWHTYSYLKYIYSLAIVIMIILITPFVNHKILQAKDEKNILSLAIFDLSGISYRTNKQLFPVEMPNETAAVFHKECYTPNWWDNFASWSDKPICKLYGQKMFREDIPVSFILKTWLNAIKANPAAYLRHRISVFDHFLNFTGHRTNTYVFYSKTPGYGAYPGADGYKKYDSAIYRFAIKFVNADNIWFAPYFWLTLLIGIFILSFKGKNRLEQLINASSFGACMYLLGFFFVGVSYGFRYAFPAATVCTGLLIALLIYKRQYGVFMGTTQQKRIATVFVAVTLLLGLLF